MPNRSALGQVVALSPDRRVIAATAASNSINLLDFESGRLLRNLARHSKDVTSLVFVSGGKTLVTTSFDLQVKFWDVATGTLLRSLDLNSPANHTWAIKLSPDGRRVAAGQSSTADALKIWDTGTGRLHKTIDVNAHSLVFSSDSKLIVSGGYGGKDCSGRRPDDPICRTGQGEIKVWDASTGKQMRTLQDADLPPVDKLDISSDGRRLLSAGVRSLSAPQDPSGGKQNGDLRIWDLANGKLKTSLKASAYVVRFAPDGKTFMTQQHLGEATRWETESGSPIRSFGTQSFAGILSNTQFIRWGVQVVDIDTGGVKTQPPDANGVSLRFGGDGKSLFAASNSMSTWDGLSVQRSANVYPYPGELRNIASFSMDGNTFVWRGRDEKSLAITDRAGTQLGVIQENEPIETVVVSADGTRFAATAGLTAKLWDVRTQKVLLAVPLTRDFDRIGISENGRRFAAGNINGGLRMWDTDSGRLLWEFVAPQDSSGIVWDIRFSLDERILLVCSGDTAKVIDAANGKLLQVFKGHPANTIVLNGALSPDGTRALTSTNEGNVRLWDVSSGRLLRSINAGTSFEMSISADSRRAFINGVMWDLDTGAKILSAFQSRDGRDWLVVTSEGYFAGTQKGAEALSVVKGLEVWSIDQFYNQFYRPDLVKAKLAGDPQKQLREAAGKLDMTKATASGSAPRVTIATGNNAVQGDQVTINAEITDQGGGIGKIEWRVNGVTLGVEQRGFGRTDDQGKSGNTVTRTLGLTPGQNRIAVLAYNAAGVIASEPAVITVVSTQQNVAGAARLYVLAVGVNDYWDSALRLKFAVPDAKGLGESLKQAGIKLYESVEVTTLLDADATAEKLDNAFGELGKQVRPQDVFLFFLAGHGKTMDARFYFLPQDFRYAGEDSIVTKGIGQDRLQSWLSRIKAQKSVLLFDACESGSLIGDRFAMRGIEEKTAIDRLTRAMGRTVLTATTDSKPALEGYRGHGAFTYSVIAGLDAADSNGDGVIDVTELAQYVDRRLPDLTFEAFKLRQVPQMSIVGSNFPLVSRMAFLPSGDQIKTTTSPGKPTHVAITATDVKSEAKATSQTVSQLRPGSQVVLVSSEGEWVIVFKDGQKLGYVEARSLATLQ